VSGAPKQWADWNDKTVAIKPLVSRSDEAGTRHVLVTNSIDVKDGMVVKQGAGCRTCKSLIGTVLYERRGNEWQLVADHRFVTVDGVWGAPPAVATAFKPEGSVELRVTRAHGNQTAPNEPLTVLVVDKQKIVKAVVPPATSEAKPPTPRPRAASTAVSAESPFPSSASGP
jgi:hypothetical protein